MNKYQKSLLIDMYKCIVSIHVNANKRKDGYKRMKKDSYSKEMLLNMLEEMLRLRKFETKILECCAKGLVYGSCHTCIGQEAVSVGTCMALKETDYVTGTHRGHGQCISKGAKTDRMFAELFGKETGYCCGKGGSMHVADLKVGYMGANGIVGGGLPMAIGSALASKVRKTGEVTIAFFSDGASNNGTFHESINMAAAWKLPVVFLCENNQFAVSVNIYSVINTDTISVRAKAYDIPGKTVDGNDVLAVYEAVKEAVDNARNGNGPSLIECKTYRMLGHGAGDPDDYRPKEAREEWKKKDPVDTFSAYLLEKGILQDEIDKVDTQITEEIEAAYKFAMDSPWPDINKIDMDVYSSDNERCVER